MNEENQEFSILIQDLVNNSTVLKMKEFRQHYDTSCYEHCFKVAYYSYFICKKYGLDYKAAARAGMLHDLFLYDWRVKQPGRKRLHGFRHPRIALENSLQLFDLSKKEQDIILKHMWPLTIKFPSYKESYIVSFVDKYCALTETFAHYKESFRLKRLYRLAYLTLCMFFIRF